MDCQAASWEMRHFLHPEESVSMRSHSTKWRTWLSLSLRFRPPEHHQCCWHCCLILKWGDRVLAAEPKERLKIAMVLWKLISQELNRGIRSWEDRVRRGWGHNDQWIQSHSSEKWLLPSRVDDNTVIQISKFLEEWIPNVPATETWEVGAGERLRSWEQALFLQKTCVWFLAPSLDSSWPPVTSVPGDLILSSSGYLQSVEYASCHTPTCN